MDHLYSPWRETYLTGTRKEGSESQECVFCKQYKEEHDEQHFILGRYPHTFVLLNLFPYNAGHLLILPIKHVASLASLAPEVRSEIMELTNHSVEILTNVMQAQGFNVGMNLGRSSGAGIPAHLHMHVLPRWNGDTNFLATLAQTKQISVDLVALYKKLKPRFQNLKLA